MKLSEYLSNGMRSFFRSEEQFVRQRNPFIVFAFCLVSFSAHAHDTCGMKAVDLLSVGNTAELWGMFKEASIHTLRGLEGLSSRAGTLSDLTPVNQPRFLNHLQYSVVSRALQTGLRFNSYWVNATSASLGPVQVQVAMDPNAACSVLAIHLSIDATIKTI